MFDRETFGRMKPRSVLINIARGVLVIKDDLVQALRNGTLRGAELDAFQREPPLTRIIHEPLTAAT